MNTFDNPAFELIDQLDDDLLSSFVKTLSEEEGKPNVTGGVLTCLLINKKTRQAHSASLSVGVVNHRCVDFNFHAHEKPRRLYAAREAGFTYVASSVTADEKNEDKLLRTYGGCLFFENDEWEMYLSFSGAPSIVDEVTVLMLGKIFKFPHPPGYTNRLQGRAEELAVSLSKEADDMED